jgi:hypothetical protein
VSDRGKGGFCAWIVSGAKNCRSILAGKASRAVFHGAVEGSIVLPRLNGFNGLRPRSFVRFATRIGSPAV